MALTAIPNRKSCSLIHLPKQRRACSEVPYLIVALPSVSRLLRLQTYFFVLWHALLFVVTTPRQSRTSVSCELTAMRPCSTGARALPSPSSALILTHHERAPETE